jgi:tripartite motif-containing protein 71
MGVYLRICLVLFFVSVAAATLAGCRRGEAPTADSAPAYVYAGEWGSEGDGDGEFDCPYDLAVAPDGTVYVVDCDNHNVQYFTPEGTYLGKWYFKWVDPLETPGVHDLGEFPETFWPVGIDVAPDGTVLVADNLSRDIISYTADGSLLEKSAGIPEGYFMDSPPRDVAVAPNGNLYVTGQYYASISYFRTGGVCAGNWRPVKYHYMCNPRLRNRIAVAANGDVYFSDFDNCRIRRFTADGSLLAKWGSRGYGDGRFLAPRGVAVDKKG